MQAQLMHAFGIALRLTGLRGVSAFALMAHPLGASVELHDAIAVRRDGGAIGAVSDASAHAGATDNNNRLEIRSTGSEGQPHVEVECERVCLWHARGVNDSRELTDRDNDCDGPPHAMLDLVPGSPCPQRVAGRTGRHTARC